jgi:hypothetical protein
MIRIITEPRSSSAVQQNGVRMMSAIFSARGRAPYEREEESLERVLHGFGVAGVESSRQCPGHYDGQDDRQQ